MRYRIKTEHLLLLLLLPPLWILVRCAWVCDDAQITFRTIDNFFSGYGLRWNIDERVQTYTHPLWMILNCGAFLFTHELLITSMFLSIALTLVAAFLVIRYSQAPRGGVVFALSIVVLSKAFIDYSSSGLENALSHLLFVIFFVIYFKRPWTGRSILFLGLVTGLAMLNRMDTILLYIFPLGYLLLHERRWGNVLLLVPGMMIMVAWEVFSLLYYGLPFPNTAYAKLNTGIPAMELIQFGLSYLANSVITDPITLCVIACGIALPLVFRQWEHLLFSAGTLLYILYVVKIGGDFMSGRFLTLPFIASIMVLATSAIFDRRKAWIGLAVPLVALGLFPKTCPLYSGPRFGYDMLASGKTIDRWGITDERMFYFREFGLWVDRRLTSLRDQSRDLGTSGARIEVRGAVGILGYWAGPNVHIVDYLALADPLLSHLPLVRNTPKENTQSVAQGWRIGHFYRAIPEGYLRSILTDQNCLVDSRLAKYYAAVRILTRDPIWSWRRLVTIARFNFGQYEGLIDRNECSFIGQDPPSPGTRMRQEAEEDYIKTLQAAPWSLDNVLRLGSIYYDNQEYAKAIHAYTRMAENYPRDPRSFINLFFCYQSLGEVDEALRYLRIAASLAPADLSILNKLALEEFNAEHLSEAESLCGIALQANPADTSIQSLHRKVLATRGRSRGK